MKDFVTSLLDFYNANFKNAEDLRQTAKKIPLDRILIETDSPYLAPVPFRGKRNESAYILHVAEKLSDIYGVPLKEIEEVTNFYQTETGQKFLQKSPELMKLGAQIGMIEAQSKQTELLNRLKPFFEKHNIK